MSSLRVDKVKNRDKPRDPAAVLSRRKEKQGAVKSHYFPPSRVVSILGRHAGVPPYTVAGRGCDPGDSWIRDQGPDTSDHKKIDLHSVLGQNSIVISFSSSDNGEMSEEKGNVGFGFRYKFIGGLDRADSCVCLGLYGG